jgi:hypothetical protein
MQSKMVTVQSVLSVKTSDNTDAVTVSSRDLIPSQESQLKSYASEYEANSESGTDVAVKSIENSQFPSGIESLTQSDLSTDSNPAAERQTKPKEDLKWVTGIALTCVALIVLYAVLMSYEVRLVKTVRLVDGNEKNEGKVTVSLEAHPSSGESLGAQESQVSRPAE